MKYLLLAFLVACSTPQTKQLEYPKAVSECDNSDACHVLLIQAQQALQNADCSGKDCSQLILNKNAAQTKYESLKQQEDNAAAIVAKGTQANREAALQEKATQDKADFYAKAEYCREHEITRLKAQENYDHYMELLRNNTAWIARNCHEQQKSIRRCTGPKNNRQCFQDVQPIVLNCGSNQRPKKLDGSRLSDFDIVNSDFAADKNTVDKLQAEKQASDSQELECASLSD